MAESKQLALAEENLEEKKGLAIEFLEKVIGINLSDCTLNVTAFGNATISKEVNVHVEMTSQWGSATVIVTFIEDVVQDVVFHPRPLPSWLWIEETEDALSAMRRIMYNYEQYFDPSYAALSQLLDQAMPNQDQMISSESFVLNITENGTHFHWVYLIGGLTVFSPLGIVLSENGHVEVFVNRWGIYKIGSTTIGITEQQAINIASHYAQIYATENQRTIKSTNAELLYEKDFYGIRGDYLYTYYPFWFINVYFEPLGNETIGVYGYLVYMFADNGQIMVATPLIYNTYYSGQSNYLPMTVGMVIVGALVTTVSALVYKRNHRKSRVK